MAVETQILDELEAAVTEISGAEESAEASFLKLADMIAGLKNNQTDPATAARITQASANLRSKAAALALAVAANPTDG